MPELTKDQQQELLSKEDSVLFGLLASAEEIASRTETFEVRRGEKVHFSFRFRALDEPTIMDLRERATSKSRVNGKIEEKFDQVRFRSYVIIEATVEEDRKAVWMNKKAWEAVKPRVITPYDFVDRVLLAGEKADAYDKINKLSGYLEEDEAIEEAKN